MSEEIKEYTEEVQDLFLQFLVSDAELFVRCKAIINPSYFTDRTTRSAIEFLQAHTDAHTVLPLLEQIKQVTGKQVEKINDITVGHVDWFLGEFEMFCRHRALEEAVYASTTLLEKGHYGEVEALVKKAVQIALVKDLGTDYFGDPQRRLEALRDRNNTISTGWAAVDEKLYGGLNRGELTIFAGQSGAGKSLFLQNFAVNWAEMGLNVVYITLELSEGLCSMRIDGMTTGYGAKDIMKNIDDVSLRVKTFQKKNKGNLQIKQLPNGTTANNIRAYIKELEIQTNQKIDAVLVDYLDLCSPINNKVSPSDLFVKDKYVSEELRNLAVELNVLFVTASQLNRSSHEETVFDHSHISGGISKINTADNVIAIFTTHAMKDNGRYQIQFMKTRSSAGVGSYVDLKFDIRTLRISDLAEHDVGAVATQTSSLVEQLKQKSIINTATPKPAPQNIIEQGLKLRELLKKK